ncbi:unnamed protein product [Rotaria magnacalcarata]|uniref:Uncharacterized protein n=1 Tax=Rotaria magnacalcarata TaxID=392030 RepID=A0A8S2P2D0_9BILA|nr:unnamed protein product [Rotaria magnacalcarata]
MDHLTKAQKMELLRKEFYQISEDKDTINRNQADTYLPWQQLNNFNLIFCFNLLCDADENCDDKIDILGMTTIIEDLSKQDEFFFLIRPRTILFS